MITFESNSRLTKEMDRHPTIVSGISNSKINFHEDSIYSRTYKLSPKFIRPFKIFKCIGKISYHLALPPRLKQIINVFHISQIKRYVPDEP